MTDTYELPELPEVELPKLPPMKQEGYTILAMQMYAVEYAEQFAKIYARLAVKAERGRAARVCEEVGLKHQSLEGTYPAGKKAGAFECAAAIRKG